MDLNLALKTLLFIFLMVDTVQDSAVGLSDIAEYFQLDATQTQDTVWQSQQTADKPTLSADASNEPLQEWNYFDVREGAHMFYWLYYTTAPEGYQDVPLVLCLAGGPGDSGTGISNFIEVGPLDMNLQPRNTTWLQAVSLLFVDNPVGSGFSYVDNSTLLTHNNQEIVRDLMTFLNYFFMVKSTQFQDVPFYIVGTSYGGKMGADLSKELYHSVKAGEIRCNFRGVLLGDPAIDVMVTTSFWVPFLYTNSLLDHRGSNEVREALNKVQDSINMGEWSNATQLWIDARQLIMRVTHNVSFQNIRQWGQLNIDEDKFTTFMNGPIRAKLGIIPDHVKCEIINLDVFYALSGDILKPVVKTVEYLIEQTDLRVVVFNGQWDLVVCIIGTEKWIYSLPFADRLRQVNRTVIDHPVTGDPGAFVTDLDKFSLYYILEAGHMVAMDNGEMALKMLYDILEKDRHHYEFSIIG